MKEPVKYFIIAILTVTGIPGVAAQSAFSPEAYMQFIDSHQDYSAGELLADYPARTTYYHGRQIPADLSTISWFDTLNSRFQLTGPEKELLSQNFFMVSERLGTHDWASAFVDIYSNDLPLFLSTDFILTSLHNSYDAILQTVEWQFLEPNLRELLHALYDHYPVLAGKYSGDERFEDILKDVDLYISVALTLAEGQEYLPQSDTRLAFDNLMAAIDEGQMKSMKLFTDQKYRKLDFSQFTPRGHYNQDIYTPDGIITLENYFKAMMWLGRIDFLLTAPPDNPWEPDWTDDELRRMQLGALVMNECLYTCGKIENLKKHERIISFMVGPDDNMTPSELQELSEGILAGHADLFQKEHFDHFISALNASDDFGQKIMSNFFLVDPCSSDPGNLPVSYKLLGQKFLIDSYVLSEVVFDRIIFNGEKIWRPLPDPLDVLGALGNEDALALLESEMESYKYAGNMARLKYMIDAYDQEFWNQSLYNTWLSAIRSLNPLSSSSGLPYFMQTTAWHHEKLNTQLTSWAQLRHDNILYGKQSYTGGTACSYPYTFVEPYPDFYGHLRLFAEHASDFFNEVLSGEQVECKTRISDYYNKYAGIMEKLEAISRKELDKIKLSDDEILFLKTMINQYMASGPWISGWYTDLFFDLEKGLGTDFTVADVHTQPTEFGGAVVGNVLHVGNGKINMGIFLAENPCNPGQYVAFAGPVSSFHQQVEPNFKRLTDQEWEEMFWTGGGSLPDRPDWVASYLADKDGNRYPAGRSLKGILYAGSGVGTSPPTQDYDYLLVFPNPATSEGHIRFVLNVRSGFNLEVHDAAGRLVYDEQIPNLFPGEHDIAFPVHRLPGGFYLLRIGLGNQAIVRELVVR